jgi:hypothetical protein
MQCTVHEAIGLAVYVLRSGLLTSVLVWFSIGRSVFYINSYVCRPNVIREDGLLRIGMRK